MSKDITSKRKVKTMADKTERINVNQIPINAKVKVSECVGLSQVDYIGTFKGITSDTRANIDGFSVWYGAIMFAEIDNDWIKVFDVSE